MKREDLYARAIERYQDKMAAVKLLREWLTLQEDYWFNELRTRFNEITEGLNDKDKDTGSGDGPRA